MVKLVSPKAVLVSDIHFSLPTLDLASKATQQAINKANELDVPLCVLGDLHDSKANLRGECMNAMIKIFSQPMKHRPFILIGNHDLINEKSKEHSLGFLAPYVNIIDEVHYEETLSALFIPYQADNINAIRQVRKSAAGLLLMHQGLVGSAAGEYFSDHSAIQLETIKNRQIISGHYHTRQTIEMPSEGQSRVSGRFDYLGNPYSLSFGEATDPEKGFSILMEDNSLQFVPTNLRRHRSFSLHASNLIPGLDFTPGDLLWVKITGSRSELAQLNRKTVAEALALPTTGWKLDLIPEDKVVLPQNTPQATKEELLDKLIDSVQNTPEGQKGRLKTLWRDLAQKKSDR